MGRQRRLSADTKSPSANACRIPIFRAAPHVRTGFSTDPLLILRPKQRHLLIRLLPANIHYRTPGKRLLLPHITAGFPPAGLLPLCKKGLQNLHNILLPVIAHSQIDTAVKQCLFLPRLHITTHCHHHRIRVHLLRPMQHLPAFPVRNICHSTRIYDIYIRFFIK